MPASGTVIGLRIDPCDPLLFRDGRPFDAAARVSGGLPNPQTLAGALRTAMLADLGFDFAKFKQQRGKGIDAALKCGGAPAWWMGVSFRGPWPAVADEDEEELVEPLFEKPATLYKTKAGAWAKAEPIDAARLPGWNGPLRQPLWKWHEPDSKAEGGYLTLRGLKQFLGVSPESEVEPAEIVARSALFADDDRIGIEIDQHSLTSADGMLYAVRFQSLCRELRHDPADRRLYPKRYDGGQPCFYAEVHLPEGADRTDFFAARTPVPFGGEGKYVSVSQVKKVDWPKPVPSRTRAVWYLASPAFLRGSPPLPTDATAGRVVAAASGPGVAVSGWDVARTAPRPTRFAVPAGAVYFVENPTHPLEHNSLDPELANRLEGWGFALQGIWKEETT